VVDYFLHNFVYNYFVVLNLQIETQQFGPNESMEGKEVSITQSNDHCIQIAARFNVITPLCQICYEEQVDALMLPCKHAKCCMRCAEKITEHGGKCPHCRTPIFDAIKIYT